MFTKNVNLNQNTHGVKKVAAKNLKKGCAEKDVKSKWVAKASYIYIYIYIYKIYICSIYIIYIRIKI